MPDRSRLRVPEAWSVGLALGGFAVAGYLTAVHYRGSLLVCTGASDCATVQGSRYAEVAGIPVALLGLAMYIVALALTVGRIARPQMAARATAVLFTLLVAGFLFSTYLTYVELFVIDAICQWCVISAAISTALLVIEATIVRRLLALSEG